MRYRSITTPSGVSFGETLEWNEYSSDLKFVAPSNATWSADESEAIRQFLQDPSQRALRSQAQVLMAEEAAAVGPGQSLMTMSPPAGR